MPLQDLILKILGTTLVAALVGRFLKEARLLEPLRQSLSARSALAEKLLSCSHCLSFWISLGCGLALFGGNVLELFAIVLLGWRGSYYLNRFIDRAGPRRPAGERRCHVCGKPYEKKRFLERQGLFFCSHACWFNHLKHTLREKPTLFNAAGEFIRQEVYPMSYKEVIPAEAQQLLQSGEGYTYVDVRSIPEYENGHPAGAVNIPFLHRQASGMAPNPDFLKVVESCFARGARLLLGCQSGARSARAAEALIAAGFTQVANVRGGFGGVRDQLGRVVEKGWFELGLPVEYGSAEGKGYSSLAAEK